MKKRNLLLGFVLAMMVLFAGSSTSARPAATPCTNFCYNEYRNCMIDCNGAPGCQQFCRDELYCCIDNCNGEPCD